MSNSISQTADRRTSIIVVPPNTAAITGGAQPLAIDTRFDTAVINNSVAGGNIILPAPERGRGDVRIQVISRGPTATTLVAFTDALGNVASGGETVNTNSCKTYCYVAGVGEWFSESNSAGVIVSGA